MMGFDHEKRDALYAANIRNVKMTSEIAITLLWFSWRSSSPFEPNASQMRVGALAELRL